MKGRPNSICYHDRALVADKFGLTKYQRDVKFMSQVQIQSDAYLPPLDETVETNSFGRRAGISASLKSLNVKMIRSARRRSFDAFRKFFTTKFTKTSNPGRKFQKRVSITSVEFWEEDYVTIKRTTKTEI